MTGWLVIGVHASLLSIGALAVAEVVAGEVVAEQELAPLSLFAGGHFGPGWWSLDIDGAGRISSSHRTAERLTSAQRRELAALVAALPVVKRKYAFGKAYVDLTTSFVLKVGAPPGVREYVVTSSLEDDARKPEAQRILAVIRFLHGLLFRADAVPPP
jgi:hypothetical protein